MALLEQAALRDISPEKGRGPARVSIAVNADSLATWFVGAMTGASRAGEILFDLVIDDQDHSTDWLRSGRVSAAVTADARPAPGCDATPLGALRYVATASSDFVAHWFADGVPAKALARAPMCVFNAKDRLQHRWITAQTGKDIMPPAHSLPSTHGFIDAACSGMAWGVTPRHWSRITLPPARWWH